MKNMPNPTYDIIIVGAGPAGTSAALFAKRNGLKPLLLEKSVFPRDKICGDALSGKSVRLLRELNLLEKTRGLPGAHIKRITFSGPKYQQFDLYLKGDSEGKNDEGFSIRREIFDEMMFRSVQDADIDTLEGFNVKSVNQENGFVTGVTGIQKESNEEFTFSSKILLGADGYNSIVSKELDLYDMDMEHTSVGIRCYYENVKDLTDQIELHYVPELNPGYLWIFPSDGNRANIGVGLSKDDAKQKKINLVNVMEGILSKPPFAERFSEAKPLEKAKGWNLPLGSIHRKNYGNGFMLLGDAAGIIDPFTGEGIGNALVSGKIAAEIAKQALSVDDNSSNILKAYDTRLWKELGSELKVSTKLQNLAKSKFLLNFVIGRASRNQDIREIISGMLSNEIPKEKLNNPFFYLKILFY
ncbi:MAG: NAD(P)/FAD-dependent oxidoreductase [Candidatus Marinimicrobia bacterium]|jgi:geranylgeranyl reductase family protein|nr:NAD(P)/FAD-dependent oxidoreductase [Candidatus Neomarinimicrobiota bacterium]MBT3936043.1 NAD(P)/FAD-dependent oxidoreductase [Candidatus Neomarinimicrobiota bacterium]MBT3960462.1 NAD(P)/FAD-dependent oxidoreductase [Candidatus Neomarinimicrobiota bacterium]MBT4383740.1 NAD(P)/FAD-dependent oxidoreductase [Candidatus Neomarinimicrobiota bacterium]MBT4636234.1 NAD(P)/FAD-dependent oxidoreductase [Candidatus Neomarinimicrobiota bacterium]